MGRPHRGLWLACVLTVAGCKFDPGGVSPGDDDDDDQPPVDARVDGAAGAIDAMPDAMIDAPDSGLGLDSDGDGVLDAVDNCVEIDNADQHDEDADTIGDVCDNCPHVSNLLQADTTEALSGEAADAVGDDCDPSEDTREQIALFEPFTGNALPDGWTVDGGGTWTVSDDHLHQTSGAVANAILFYDDATYTDAWFDTAVTIDSVTGPGGPSSNTRAVAPLIRYTADPSPATGTGYACSLYDDVNNSNGSTFIAYTYTNGVFGSVTGAAASSLAQLADGQFYRARASAVDTTISCELDDGSPHVSTGTNVDHASGAVALRSHGITASWDYVVVFTPRP